MEESGAREISVDLLVSAKSCFCTDFLLTVHSVVKKCVLYFKQITTRLSIEQSIYNSMALGKHDVISSVP